MLAAELLFGVDFAASPASNSEFLLLLPEVRAGFALAVVPLVVLLRLLLLLLADGDVVVVAVAARVWEPLLGASMLPSMLELIVR